MEWIIKGRVWKFGDNVCPDTAIGYPYSELLGDLRNVKDPKELAKIFMINIDPEIPKKVRKGDLMVVGKNFGTGRAHPPFFSSLKGAGISAIIGQSFARNFFRSCISLGLPILECTDITKYVEQGDELQVNYETGEIRNLTSENVIKTDPLPSILKEIIKVGGSMPWLVKKVKEKQELVGQF